MGYQKIKGITLTRVGKKANIFPMGRAFGGWIYGGNVNMGFNSTPTTITLDIALDVKTDGGGLMSTDPGYVGIGFDIDPKDLKVNWQGQDEYFKIKIGENEYGPMYLTSYDINGSVDSKTLKVEFTDHSIMLDKIYVGLFKREGFDPKHASFLLVDPELSALCPDCTLTSPSHWVVVGKGSAYIQSASYFLSKAAPNGKKLIDGESKILSYPKKNKNYKEHYEENIENGPNWKTMGGLTDQYAPAGGGVCDINGGTLIIGTEEFNTNICGDNGNVSYNFTELLYSLAGLKIKFTKVNSENLVSSYGDTKELDLNENYRKNYNGTLREVLNNWCSDFGLNYQITGKTICFSNSKKPNAIGEIEKVMIPTEAPGKPFNAHTDFAIGGYTEKVNIKESFAQSIVTADVRPRRIKNVEKQLKRICGFIATHPLDWLDPEMATTEHSTLYNVGFENPKFLNAYAPDRGFLDYPYFNIHGPLAVAQQLTHGKSFHHHHWYTNRAHCVIDTCAALIRSNEALRDIYAGSLIHLSSVNYPPVDPLSAQNGFNSFGFSPLGKANPANRAALYNWINTFILNNKGGDEREFNFNTHDVYFGFYDEDTEQEIKNWERSIAANIGKWGILTKGNLAGFPYLSPDLVDQPWSSAGLFGLKGIEARKITSTTEPPNKTYPDYDSQDFPFKEIFKARGNYLNAGVRGINLGGLHVAQLDNNWGTYENEVDYYLARLNTAVNGCNNVLNTTAVIGQAQNNQNNANTKTFPLKDYAPKIHKIEGWMLKALLERVVNIRTNKELTDNDLLSAAINIREETRVGNAPASYNDMICPSLAIMIIPRVGYPSAYPISVDKKGEEETNPYLEVRFSFNTRTNFVMQKSAGRTAMEKNRQLATKLPDSICDFNMLDYVCANGHPKDNIADCSVYSANPFTENKAVNDSSCNCADNAGGNDPFRNFQYGFNNLTSRNIYVSIRANKNANLVNQGQLNAVGNVKRGNAPIYTPASTSFNITYPVESWLPEAGRSAGLYSRGNYNYYYGILTHDINIQVRNPATVQIYGDYWQGDDNVAKIEHISNEIDPSVESIIDPVNKEFYNPIYDLKGNEVRNVKAYHDLIKDLSKVNSSEVRKEMTISVIGDITDKDAGLVKDHLKPEKGLTSLSFSLTQDGFLSSATFANLPPTRPKKEAILNKITPRLNKI